VPLGVSPGTNIFFATTRIEPYCGRQFEADVTPERTELLRDLDRLQNVRLEHRRADWLVRTDATPSPLANWLRKTFMASQAAS